MIKGEVIRRHVRRSSQTGLASPTTTFRKVVPSTIMSMCHSASGRLGSQARFRATEQVCPTAQGTGTNVPAQFLLAQGVSFLFNCPHTSCPSSTPPVPWGSVASRTDGKRCNVEAGTPTAKGETGSSGPLCFLLPLGRDPDLVCCRRHSWRGAECTPRLLSGWGLQLVAI